MVGNPMPMGYPMMPQGYNWQQEMLNRLGTLQNQIQNNFQQPQQQIPQQNYIRGKQIGNKEEVFAAPSDFEAQYFPCGSDTIYMKKLGMDGKSQIFEYKLNMEKPQEQLNYNNEFENIQKSFNILNDKYNHLNNEITTLKEELGIKKEGI